jgi:hypothetical protein
MNTGSAQSSEVRRAPHDSANTSAMQRGADPGHQSCDRQSQKRGAKFLVGFAGLLVRLAGFVLLIGWACMLSARAQTLSVASSQVTFTATAGAYSAGQCLGGVLTVPGLVRPGGPGGAMLTGVSFLDAAHQTAANDAMDILLFSQAPSGTYTDQANCQVASADRTKFIGTVSIAAANCTQDQGPTTTLCTITPTFPLVSLPLPVVSGTVFAVPIVKATPTYGAITLIFNFLATPYSGN